MDGSRLAPKPSRIPTKMDSLRRKKDNDIVSNAPECDVCKCKSPTSASSKAMPTINTSKDSSVEAIEHVRGASKVKEGTGYNKTKYISAGLREAPSSPKNRGTIKNKTSIEKGKDVILDGDVDNSKIFKTPERRTSRLKLVRSRHDLNAGGSVEDEGEAVLSANTSLINSSTRQSSIVADDTDDSFFNESPSSTPPNGSNIAVAVRVRPLTAREVRRGESLSCSWDENSIIELIDHRIDNKNAAFSSTYESLYTPEHSTVEIYDAMVRPIVVGAMEGFNGSVFAYGQTSTGKTFTMNGTSDMPGIIPLAIDDVFTFIAEHPEREFLLRVSYMEIYNEVSCNHLR